LVLVFGAVEISALRRAVIHYNKKQKKRRGVFIEPLSLHNAARTHVQLMHQIDCSKVVGK